MMERVGLYGRTSIRASFIALARFCPFPPGPKLDNFGTCRMVFPEHAEPVPLVVWSCIPAGHFAAAGRHLLLHLASPLQGACRKVARDIRDRMYLAAAGALGYLHLSLA